MKETASEPLKYSGFRNPSYTTSSSWLNVSCDQTHAVTFSRLADYNPPNSPLKGAWLLLSLNPLVALFTAIKSMPADLI